MNRIIAFAGFVLLLNSCKSEVAKNNVSSDTVQVSLLEQQLWIDQADQVISGSENWTGPEDGSIIVKMVQERTGLLFTFSVTDDELFANTDDLEKNDHLECYFDFRPDRIKKHKYEEPGVFKVDLVPGFARTNPNVLFFDPKYYVADVPGMELRTRQIGNHFHVSDIFIPFEGLSKVHFRPQNRFELDIVMHDVDSFGLVTRLSWTGEDSKITAPDRFKEVGLKGNARSIHQNVILIEVDQLSAAVLSTYGNKFVKTPGIDALAMMGTRFLNSFSATPNNADSRRALLSGILPAENSKGDGSNQNLSHRLKENGYQCKWIGSWSMDQTYPQAENVFQIEGFDLLSFYPRERLSEQGRYMDPHIVETAIKSLKGGNSEPFFMVISLSGPSDISTFYTHPHLFSPPYNSKAIPDFPSGWMRIPAESELNQYKRRDSLNHRDLFKSQRRTYQDWANYRYQYGLLVEKTDHLILELLTNIEKLGLDQNTAIILTSPNGDGYGLHQWTGGDANYESILRVPLIIALPGTSDDGNVVTKDMVSGLDLFPTILDLAGIFKDTIVARGQSLIPLIKSNKHLIRSEIYSSYHSIVNQDTIPVFLIEDNKYKYTYTNFGTRREQLFNLSLDPLEMKNLVNVPEYNQILIHYRNKLKALRNSGQLRRIEAFGG